MLRGASRSRRAEAVLRAGALLAVGIVVFAGPIERLGAIPDSPRTLLVFLLPFILLGIVDREALVAAYAWRAPESGRHPSASRARISPGWFKRASELMKSAILTSLVWWCSLGRQQPHPWGDLPLRPAVGRRRAG
jgi:hypothetical protein